MHISIFFYFFVKSKLNLAPSFPLLLNESNLQLTSEFNKASCFKKSLQNVSKDHEDEHFKLIKVVLKCRIFLLVIMK